MFVTTLWQIWKDRNKKSFDNLEVDVLTSFKLIINYANEIMAAFKSPLICESSSRISCNWSFPMAGEVKLNADGCWFDYEVTPKSGIGGMFRDSAGAWILGFYGKCNCFYSLEAELWAIFQGLLIVKEKGIYYTMSSWKQILC